MFLCGRVDCAFARVCELCLRARAWIVFACVCVDGAYARVSGLCFYARVIFMLACIDRWCMNVFK